VIPGKTYDHATDVKGARNGLENALGYLDNALRSKGWNNEAREYLLEQKEMISARLKEIDDAFK